METSILPINEVENKMSNNEFIKSPCSCLGGNPSCFKCGGWGYIDAIGESRSAVGSGELAPRQPKRKGKEKKRKTREKGSISTYLSNLPSCPQCGAKVKNLTRHTNKVHNKPMPLDSLPPYTPFKLVEIKNTETQKIEKTHRYPTLKLKQK